MDGYRIEGTDTVVDAHDLIRRILAMAPRGRRVVVGIVGAPAAGKSTLAAVLAERLGARAAVVGMDGFHLAQAELERQGIAERKGAWDTFDAAGYAALVRRLREDPRPVYAPVFDRAVEEPIANATRVDDGAIVITEGNYLLDDAGDWPEVAPLLDAVWSVDVDDRRRRDRLRARHVAFGRTPEQADAWMASVDDPNAVRIAAGRHRADLRLTEIVGGGASDADSTTTAPP